MKRRFRYNTKIQIVLYDRLINLIFYFIKYFICKNIKKILYVKNKYCILLIIYFYIFLSFCFLSASQLKSLLLNCKKRYYLFGLYLCLNLFWKLYCLFCFKNSFINLCGSQNHNHLQKIDSKNFSALFIFIFSLDCEMENFY